jgi:hypothetical protein
VNALGDGQAVVGRLPAFAPFSNPRASTVALRATTRQAGAVVNAGGPPDLKRLGEIMVRHGRQPV